MAIRGAGPYVKFDGNKVNVRKVQESGSDIEVVYERAKPYLLQWKEELISEHGYSEELPLSDSSLNEESLLFEESLLMALSCCDPALYPTSSGTEPRRLFKLPTAAQAFACDSSMWEPVFTSLHSKQLHAKSRDLFLDEALPLQNIFYLLQTMFDSMLSLVIKEDKGYQTVSRIMPAKEWIQQNSDILKDVLGLPSTTKVEEDAENHGFSVDYDNQSDDDDYDRGRSDYDDYGDRYDYDDYDRDLYDDDNSDRDYTACDAHDCGYCGKCPY